MASFAVPAGDHEAAVSGPGHGVARPEHGPEPDGEREHQRVHVTVGIAAGERLQVVDGEHEDRQRPRLFEQAAKVCLAPDGDGVAHRPRPGPLIGGGEHGLTGRLPVLGEVDDAIGTGVGSHLRARLPHLVIENEQGGVRTGEPHDGDGVVQSQQREPAPAQDDRTGPARPGQSGQVLGPGDLPDAEEGASGQPLADRRGGGVIVPDHDHLVIDGRHLVDVGLSQLADQTAPASAGRGLPGHGSSIHP